MILAGGVKALIDILLAVYGYGSGKYALMGLFVGYAIADIAAVVML
jgi:hypothetical protein